MVECTGVALVFKCRQVFQRSLEVGEVAGSNARVGVACRLSVGVVGTLEEGVGKFGEEAGRFGVGVGKFGNLNRTSF